MKKFLLSLFLLSVGLIANAADYELFLQGALQKGGTSTISLMMKNQQDIMAISGFIELPKDVTVTDVVSTTNVDVAFAQDERIFKLVYTTAADVYIPASTEAVEIGKVTVECASSVELGEYNFTVFGDELAMALYPSANSACDFTDYVGTLKVQRSATVMAMPEGYGLEILPFAAGKKGDYNLEILMKCADPIRDVEFDLTLPKGMLIFDTATEDASVASVSTSTSIVNKAPTATTSDPSTEMNSAHISFKGSKTGAASMHKYFKANTNFVKIATLKAHILTDAEYVDWGSDPTYAIESGIQDLKISNIKMLNHTDGTTKYTGDYMASVFVGETNTNKNPILYGHFTNDVVTALTKSADVKKMFDDIVSVDFTGVDIDIEAATSINDLLDGKLIVNSKNGSGMSRNMNGNKWGSICLPFTPNKRTGIAYYYVSSATDNSVTLTAFDKTAVIPANTPVFFNTTVQMSFSTADYIDITKCTPVTGASANGLTTVGTYEKINLTDGDGYYLSGDKFYNDWATILPFRAYLKGGISSGVKALKIYVEDETGLRDVTNEFSEEEIYNLQGVKLNKTQKGINIINGKKVLVK